MSTLLEQFLVEECTSDVLQWLDEAQADPVEIRRHLNFNRFEVTIELDRGVVALQDVLDATDAGLQLISVADFTAALRRCFPL